MFGQAPRGSLGPSLTHSNPQRSCGRQRKGGTSPRCRCSNFANFQRVRRGCHASTDGSPLCPPAEAFPCWRQICRRRPRRGRRPFAGVFALCRAAGRPADQYSVRSEQIRRQIRRHERADPAGQARPKQGPALSDRHEKNYAWCRNHPATAELTDRRRAKPPSPSPSITRRRTPAVFAAGVPLCEGSSLFVGHPGHPPRPGGTEARVRSFRPVGVVSVAFARVWGRVRGPVPRDGTRPLIIAGTPRSRPAPVATAARAASARPGAKRRSSDCRPRIRAGRYAWG